MTTYYERNREKCLEKAKQYKKQHRDKVREWDKKYREKHKKQRRDYKREYDKGKHQKNNLKRHYNLTIADYEKMLNKQNGVCAICGQPEEKKRLSVDHDHETGLIRELLCSKCNLGLGYFRDKLENLNKASDYLIKHKNPAQ